MQYPRCGVTLHVRATARQSLRERPAKIVRMKTRSDLRTVLDHNSMLLTHTKLKTRMGNKLPRQSFGILKIARTVYFLSYMCVYACGRRKKNQERKKKMNRIETLNFVFLNLLKVIGTFGLDITLEYEREVVLSFLSPSASFFWESFLYLMYIGGHFKAYQILKYSR